MVHWYRIRYSLLVSGRVVRTYSYEKLSDEESLAKLTSEPEINLTWNNINDYYRQHVYSVPFSLNDTKKGRVIKFDNSDYFFFEKDYLKKIEESKHHDLSVFDLKVVCSTHVLDKYKTIQDVLNYHNAELATQFLKERGLFNLEKSV